MGRKAAIRLFKSTWGKVTMNYNLGFSTTNIVPKIMIGDAANLDLQDAIIDVIITSPPYNLGKRKWPMGGRGNTPRENGIGYDDNLFEYDYQTWQLKCLTEWYRVAKQGASLFYNHKVRQKDGRVIHPVEWLGFQDNPWILRQEIIWDRGSTHNHCATLFWPHDERIYWLTKGNPTLPDKPIAMSTIWKFHGPRANTWHPAPFPPELPRRCLEAVGRPRIVVMDPFGGSMTTCVVAAEMGFKSIGIDNRQEYVERSVNENGWKR